MPWGGRSNQLQGERTRPWENDSQVLCTNRHGKTSLIKLDDADSDLQNTDLVTCTNMKNYLGRPIFYYSHRDTASETSYWQNLGLCLVCKANWTSFNVGFLPLWVELRDPEQGSDLQVIKEISSSRDLDAYELTPVLHRFRKDWLPLRQRTWRRQLRGRWSCGSSMPRGSRGPLISACQLAFLLTTKPVLSKSPEHKGTWSVQQETSTWARNSSQPLEFERITNSYVILWA